MCCLGEELRAQGIIDLPTSSEPDIAAAVRQAIADPKMKLIHIDLTEPLLEEWLGAGLVTGSLPAPVDGR